MERRDTVERNRSRIFTGGATSPVATLLTRILITQVGVKPTTEN